MKKVGVLIASGFEEIEAVTPIDVLRRAGLEVITIGIKSKTVVGSHNITFNCDYEISEFEGSIDTIVIPGGMPGAKNILESEKAIELIKDMNSKNYLIGAICASPGLILGSIGLLKNKKYTCYPGFEKNVTDGSFLEDRVVLDGNLLTSRGPGTSLEFSLALVEQLVSIEAANKLRNGMIVN